MTDDLVIGALEKALFRGFVNKGAIIHSDRGSQYSSIDYRRLLKKRRLKQSMSGKGNCYDNAQVESFWARFKIELVEGGVFRSAKKLGPRSSAISKVIITG
jgi:transposase InsO family protein